MEFMMLSANFLPACESPTSGNFFSQSPKLNPTLAAYDKQPTKKGGSIATEFINRYTLIVIRSSL